LGNDYSINAEVPQEPALLDGSRLKRQLPPPPRWTPSRPGEALSLPRSSTPYLGTPAPDAGYVLRIYRHLEPSIVGAEGIDKHDLRAAIVATALRRASVMGRAPVRQDVEWALAYWGFGLQGEMPPADRPPSGIGADERAELFAGAAHDVLRQRLIASHPSLEALELHPRHELLLGRGSAR
jgi:hypothetical protein